MILLFGFVLGISAGLRSMTPAAVVAWAAQLGWPDLGQTSLAFVASPITAWVLTLFAGIELVFEIVFLGDWSDWPPGHAGPERASTAVDAG